MNEKRWSARGAVRCPVCGGTSTFVFMDAWAICDDCNSEWFTEDHDDYSDDDLSEPPVDGFLVNGLTSEQIKDLSQMRIEHNGGGEQGEPV